MLLSNMDASAVGYGVTLLPEGTGMKPALPGGKDELRSKRRGGRAAFSADDGRQLA